MSRFSAFALLLCIVSLFSCGSSATADNSFVDCSRVKVPADMSCIPGGPFWRGSERSVRKLDSGKIVKDESPRARIVVSTFLLDRTEATVEEYNRCVAAGGCKKARTNYGRPYLGKKQPKLGANWYQARAFCKWKGKRLPTETEWEKGARGENGELYPWGNDKGDCRRAIVHDSSGKGCGRGTTWDVASRPPLRYGLYDMAGNAHEWVADWYSPSYRQCGKDCSGRDPQGPCGGRDNCPGHKFKVVRGGSWYWPAKISLSSHRRPHYPANNPYHHFGFRCARSVASAGSDVSK